MLHRSRGGAASDGTAASRAAVSSAGATSGAAGAEVGMAGAEQRSRDGSGATRHKGGSSVKGVWRLDAALILWLHKGAEGTGPFRKRYRDRLVSRRIGLPAGTSLAPVAVLHRCARPPPRARQRAALPNRTRGGSGAGCDVCGMCCMQAVMYAAEAALPFRTAASGVCVCDV